MTDREKQKPAFAAVAEDLDRIETWNPGAFINSRAARHMPEAWKDERRAEEKHLIRPSATGKAIARATEPALAAWIASRLRLAAELEAALSTAGLRAGLSAAVAAELESLRTLIEQERARLWNRLEDLEAPAQIERHPKAILTGTIPGALEDLRPELLAFDPRTNKGATRDGPFVLMDIRRPPDLRAVRLSGYQIHPSAHHYARELRECECLALAAVRRF